MRTKYAEFTVTIPVPGEEPLRGKFKVKTNLSYRDLLNMDAMRRQLLGSQGGDPSDVASLISSGLAKIRTHVVESPSWWRDADNGLEFDDVGVILAVLNEVTKAEAEAAKELQDAANKASEALK